MNDAAQPDDPTDPKPAAEESAPPEASVTPDAVPQPPATAFDPDPADDPADDPTPTTAVHRVRIDEDGPEGPIDTDFPTAPAKGGLTAALVAIASGLLGAAVLISAGRSRGGDPSVLYGRTYGLGIGATVVLLGVALFGAVAIGRSAGGQARGDLVTWPGAVGILATAPMILVGVSPSDEGAWEAYLVGGVIACLAAIGYVLARRPAFVVVCIAGLGILYVQGFRDTVSDSFKNDSRVVVVAVALTVFVVAVTVLGWLLPSRAISGVVSGVVGAVGLVGALAVLFAERQLAGIFGSFGSVMPTIGSSVGSESNFPMLSTNPADYSGDVGWILAMVAALTVLWALAALVSDHSGFKVLAIALPAIAIPLGTAVLDVRHPARWEGGLGLVGVLLLGAALLLARRKARRAVGQ